jgi:hypothetical protein
MNEKDNDEYLTVAQLAKKYPAFSQGSIRWLIHNCENNGFKSTIRRIGTKIIIKDSEFRKWLDSKFEKEM